MIEISNDALHALVTTVAIIGFVGGSIASLLGVYLGLFKIK
jgi:hypothetical protein